jgi:hypothetical protein
MRRLLLPLICLLALGSCKKENIKSTGEGSAKISPKPYLPTYPGSYWIYNDGDTIVTGDKYQLAEIYDEQRDFGRPELLTCRPIKKAFFTVYNGSYVYDYILYGLNSKGECYTRPLLSEEVGKKMTLYANKYYRTMLMVKSKDVQITLPNGVIYDSVIVMNKVNYGGPELDVELYYAKHIGFIGQQTIENYFKPDTIPVWNKYLVEYYINN